MKVSLCRGVPLRPSNHAITLHFATLFNLRKETLFSWPKYRTLFQNVCHFKFGVSEFFGFKNRSHHNVGRAPARIALCSIVYPV